MRIGRRPGNKAGRPNGRMDPYVSWHCRETVTDAASQAAGHRRSLGDLIRRRVPSLRTGFVGALGIRWKSTRATSEHIRHTRYRGRLTAVTRQENQRAEISMNDIIGRLAE